MFNTVIFIDIHTEAKTYHIGVEVPRKITVGTLRERKKELTNYFSAMSIQSTIKDKKYTFTHFSSQNVSEI